MKNTKTTYLVFVGLMIAAVCMGTIVIQIPMPATNGFINIGDSIIFITSILFGPMPGMIAGGIGSALADILSGYAHWAIFTLIIKGAEGFIVGVLMKKSINKIRMIISSFVGASFMVIGYYIAGGILEGSFIVALESIPGNIMQGVGSIVIGVPVAMAILKTNYISKNNLIKN
ncbi:ECF transporter S component [Tepidibacter formicigenes]|jgi:uncharacterized membrane protein|uniref:Uncharacterized membrane protein n=1 Tax=Tepidibacter formicigenes DSM 15518 TaxID=1123349 RepID=A0A1M6LXZ7_9FIRM|nr:ECF transporter S component [Tepidibacter formicigenes]SHJ76030.1 Uncharacterized membrane protein [Tepidibacter formicigenes DSM 15518]